LYRPDELHLTIQICNGDFGEDWQSATTLYPPRPVAG
jgi:hypothetical protein